MVECQAEILSLQKYFSLMDRNIFKYLLRGTKLGKAPTPQILLIMLFSLSV
jgi:hypothetical protein